FFSRRRRDTRLVSDWSSDVCSSDLLQNALDVLPLSRFPERDETGMLLGRELLDIVIRHKHPGRELASKIVEMLAEQADVLRRARSEERRVGRGCRWGGRRCL